MTTGGAGVPAQRLGRELKRLRDAAGKTQAEVAKYVGTPSTTISKIENGERNAPIPHLKLMLQLYQVEPAHAETLIKLAEQAREPGWWVGYSDDLPKWFREYVRVESGATQVWPTSRGTSRACCKLGATPRPLRWPRTYPRVPRDSPACAPRVSSG